MVIEDGASMRTELLFPFFSPVLDAPIKINTGGSIVADNEALTLRGTTTFNGGTMTGTVTQLGDMIVESAGTIDSTGIFTWGGNGHRTTIQSGGELTINARSLSNIPFVSSYAGHIDIQEGGHLAVARESFDRWGLSGSLHLADGASADGDGINNSGFISGTGRINSLVRNSGTIAPGDSVGTLVFGQFEQTETGRLEIELGGTRIGIDTDFLQANTATLDGTLSVSLVDGFMPTPGTQFPFLSILPLLSIQGGFSSLEFDAPLGVEFDGQIVSTSPHLLAFEVTQARFLADFDGDVDVDLNDVNSLLSQGSIVEGIDVVVGQNEQFDLTGDGLIDDADLDQWLVFAAAAHGLPLPYLRGDSNLDGLVDVSDFNAWNGSKFTANFRWDAGDFNGDGIADVSDFNLWNANKFQSSQPLNVVPEPGNAITMMMSALVAVCFLTRRGQRSPPKVDSKEMSDLPHLAASA